MKDYEKQATDFLEKTNTIFSCKFLKNDYYFSEDKEKRDIYEIVLSRKGRRYCFNFGQSINNSGFYYTKGKKKIDIEDRNLVNCKTLSTWIRQRDYDFLNNGKSDIIHLPKEPTAYDILSCVTKYEPGTHKEFCDEFGYDIDSINALKIYNAVKEEYLNLCTLFNSEELELMQKIQ